MLAQSASILIIAFTMVICRQANNVTRFTHAQRFPGEQNLPRQTIAGGSSHKALFHFSVHKGFHIERNPVPNIAVNITFRVRTTHTANVHFQGSQAKHHSFLTIGDACSCNMQLNTRVLPVGTRRIDIDIRIIHINTKIYAFFTKDRGHTARITAA